MADDVMGKAAADAESVSANGAGASVAVRRPSRADRARSVAYRSRFAGFYVLLAVIAGVGVGTLLVLVGRGSPAPAPAWSAWEPSGSIERRSAQIGDHVGDQYRLPSGNPLATVSYAGPPSIANADGSALQVRALAVQRAAAAGQEDVDAIPAGPTVMYILCGRGPLCSIPEGTDSPQRTQLLRRQALELALLSFKHLDGIDAVLVLLPPRPNSEQANVVLLERPDVAPALERPLRETLTAELAPGVGEITLEEGRTIDRYTQSRVYQISPTQQQDGSFVLILVPAPS